MVVELKSLLPMLQERLEEQAEENTPVLLAETFRNSAQETAESPKESVVTFQLPEGSGNHPADSRLTDLMEQLLAVSGRNADSSQRIADLLEQQNSDSSILYS
jgi:hypothetical protein